MNILGYAQKLGKALMLPIATLPVAALLLRLGQPDLLGIPFMAAAGDAIFSQLPLLFGLGIAIGLSKDGSGAAGLAGAVAYFVLSATAKRLMLQSTCLSLAVSSQVSSQGTLTTRSTLHVCQSG